jgi:hypothetical protein
MKAHPRVKSTGLEKSKHTVALATSDYTAPVGIQSAGAISPARSLPNKPNTGVDTEPRGAQHTPESWDNTGNWRSGPDGFFD